jgi:hypothetical protein
MCGVGGWVWLRGEGPLQEIGFTLKTSGGGRVKGVAVLPRLVAKHPVAIYLDGSGAGGVQVSRELGQFVELGLAAIALDCERTNQAAFGEALTALHRYLAGQDWAQSNAIAWIGSGSAVERAASFALTHRDLHPLLVVHGGLEGGASDRECERLVQRARLAGTRVDVLTFPSQPQALGEDRAVAVRLIAEHCAREMPPPDYAAALEKAMPPPPGHRGPASSAGSSAVESGSLVPEGLLSPALSSRGGEGGAAGAPGESLNSTAVPPQRGRGKRRGGRVDQIEAPGAGSLAPEEARRFNVAMQRAGLNRRELWRAVGSSRQPERRTVMNVIGGLEDYDLAHVSARDLKWFVGQAWQARRKYPWCRDTPLELFEKYTANPRTYEEPLEEAPFWFLPRPLPPVKYCHTTADACNALWTWLSRRVRYRTEPFTPEATPRERLNQEGWCIEGVTLYNYFGRCVGLPMRPAYTVWPTVKLAPVHSVHWWSEVWSVEEGQWHAVDSADYDRTYNTFWMPRVPKSTILASTGERGGWNAIAEERWEAFTNTIGLFYPSGQVRVQVLDRGRPASGQRVMAQSWYSQEVRSVAAARTSGAGTVEFTLGRSARYPYRILIDRAGETDWQWLTVQSNLSSTVTLRLENRRPFDVKLEPPAMDFSTPDGRTTLLP